MFLLIEIPERLADHINAFLLWTSAKEEMEKKSTENIVCFIFEMYKLLEAENGRELS